MDHWSPQIPSITTAQLVEYLAADDKSRRRIVYDCKYHPKPADRHPGEAQFHICSYLAGTTNWDTLKTLRSHLESSLSSSDRDYQRNRFNAYCIDCFLNSYNAELIPSKASASHTDSMAIFVKGVRINAEIPIRVSMSAGAGHTKGGGLAFRFDPITLSSNKAQWHASIIYGYLNQICGNEDHKIKPSYCGLYNVTDGQTCYAPRNAASRYKSAVKACGEFYESWHSIESMRTTLNSPSWQTPHQKLVGAN